jgi:hypothetical protein
VLAVDTGVIGVKENRAIRLHDDEKGVPMLPWSLEVEIE